MELVDRLVAAIAEQERGVDDPAQTVAEIRKVKREYLAAIEAGE